MDTNQARDTLTTSLLLMRGKSFGAEGTKGGLYGLWPAARCFFGAFWRLYWLPCFGRLWLRGKKCLCALLIYWARGGAGIGRGGSDGGGCTHSPE